MNASVIESEELRDPIRQLLTDEDWLLAAREDETVNVTRASALWRKLADLGWLGVTIDEKFGGLGLGLNELSVLYFELGRYLAPCPVLPHMLAIETIEGAGSAEQQSNWLPKLAEGEMRACVALPEMSHALPLTAADGKVLGRMQHLIGNDDYTHVFLPIKRSDGTLAMLVTPAYGVTLQEHPSVDPSRKMYDATVDIFIAKDEGDLLNLTESQWANLLNHASIALALDSAAGAEHILEMTVEYMCVREQFGRPIGSFQALKHRAANWKVLTEATNALVQNAVSLVAEGSPESASAASGAKFYACDAYAAIAGDAIQIHGGIGFTWEHACHRFLKRAMFNQALYGSSMQHQDRAAEFLFHWKP